MTTYCARFPTLIIALAALVAIPLGAASAVEQAGVTAAVQGNVDFLSVLDAQVHQATGGDEIYLGDEISSSADSGMQLMLLDETIFTIGPETDLTIDDFVYDPTTGAGQLSASLTKGVFRFVAGNIAQGNPEDMEINLPAGTIGIRGTSGIISILNDSMIGGTLGDAAEGSVLVVLLETGGENIHESGLVVTSAGQSVELTTPGFGTVFAPGQAPTIPFIVETSFFSNEQVSLAPSDPNQNEADEAEDGPEGDSADQADQQGENRPGKPGENDGEPPGGGGPPDGEGEYVEGDGHPDGEGEYVEGDGPPNGGGEYVEGDGPPNRGGEYVEGDGPPNGGGEYVEGDGPPNGGGEYAGGYGETDTAYDGSPNTDYGKGSLEGGGYDDGGGHNDGGYSGYYDGDGQPVDGGYGETYIAGGGEFGDGGYDDGGGYYYDDGGYDDGFGDNFFGDGGMGMDFFVGDGGGDGFCCDPYGGFDGGGFEGDGFYDDGGFFVDCPDCFDLGQDINGIAKVSEFADVFTLTGTASYGGVRPFFQTLLSGSPSNIQGTVTFTLSIDFDARQLCALSCFIFVDTDSFGGNISSTTTVTTVDFSGRTGPAIDIFTDADLTNVSFTATHADLFDFNDGTANSVANNLAVDVHYDDLAGNVGGTGFFTPTDPATFVQ